MRDPLMITIESGADAGKTFRARQMSAGKTEEWAGRALLAVLGSPGGRADASQLMETAQTSRGAALWQAMAGGIASLGWDQVKPLLDMLLGQIDRVPNPEKPSVVIPLTPANLDNHIQDVRTLLRLRGEVLRLSLDFFGDAGSWSLFPGAAPAPRD